MARYRVGIDVGSTNTDVAIVDENGRPFYTAKVATTPDVTTGIISALEKAVRESGVPPDDIVAVMYGTTHALNAIITRRGLYRVGVIRIGLPATTSIEPMLDWPPDLRKAVGDTYFLVRGGFEYTGEEISSLDEESIRRAAEIFKEKGVESVAIIGVFSPVRPDHEARAAEIVREVMGEEVPVSLSASIGSIGLLERENATILNSAIIGVMRRSISAVRDTMDRLGLGSARLYLAQNDGTIISAEMAEKYPIFTVAAAVSNSVRGAYVLTGIRDAIVVDTGGTTTNIGVLEKGFPRESSSPVVLGGVRTSFMMPDFVSIGVAGGSIVKAKNGEVTVGPESVGYELVRKGIAWGGDTITATDVALALNRMRIDDPSCNPERAAQKIPRELAERAYQYIVNAVEEGIDRIKTKPEPLPVILVGGGSAMLPRKLKGASEVIRPEGAQSANAIGAATALIGATVEKTYSYEQVERSKALDDAKSEAKKRAIESGADPSTVEIAFVEEVSMPYLPGNVVKVRVKAVGRARI
ncbi:MAG: hydantoinase/oxoprolinase family protein [Desulfurococcales archaeon]|nr:hydantoinase/oxoprolinase family protein [Desulfurococcales archaeon]